MQWTRIGFRIKPNIWRSLMVKMHEIALMIRQRALISDFVVLSLSLSLVMCLLNHISRVRLLPFMRSFLRPVISSLCCLGSFPELIKSSLAILRNSRFLAFSERICCLCAKDLLHPGWFLETWPPRETDFTNDASQCLHRNNPASVDFTLTSAGTSFFFI